MLVDMLPNKFKESCQFKEIKAKNERNKIHLQMQTRATAPRVKNIKKNQKVSVSSKNSADKKHYSFTITNYTEMSQQLFKLHKTTLG